MHLTVDAVSRKALTIAQVYNFLMNAPTELGMTRIQPVIVVPYGEDVHGYVLLAESHVAFHGKPDGRLHLDIFSCKPFDIQKALAFCDEHFQLETITTHVLPDRLDLSTDQGKHVAYATG